MFLLDSYRKHHAFELIQQGKVEQLSHMKLNHVINQLNDKGHSLLYEAIKHFGSDLSIIHKLLECPDLDINLGCDNAFATKSPLYLACKKGHEEIVKLLLSYNNNNSNHIQINKFSIMIERNEFSKGNEEFRKSKNNLKIHEKKHKNEGDLVFPCAKTALYIAIENGHFGIAEILMGRNDIDINKGYAGYLTFGTLEVSELHGRSILFLAMKKASKHFVKSILKKPNVDTNFGIKEVLETNLFEKFPHILRDQLDKIEYITPLRIAIDDHFSMDIIEILLENSKTNPNECQAFVQVCKSCNLEMVQLFLNNPNLDINQGCPLAYCLENSEILSRFLSNTKLDLNIEDSLILKNAIKLEKQTRLEVITKLLPRKDLDVNRGFVFYELCSKGDLELVKLFVSMRKDLKPDQPGPLIKYKHTGSEGFLDVEAHKQATNLQFRPIEIAYINKHEELAQYLIENTHVKPLDISKLLFEDEKEPGSFYKVNQNGKRELSSGIYALWSEDDEDKSSVYSSGKFSDF